MNLADKLSEQLLEVESGCWEFIGAKTGAGYGALNVGYKKQESTHVLAYKLTKGNILKGLIVRHTCNNKICCNPDHLILGTHQDNKNDEMALGMHVKGSKQGQAKLTENDIPVIRKLLNDGFTGTEIARLYDVSSTTIYYIRSGQNWGWLR